MCLSSVSGLLQHPLFEKIEPINLSRIDPVFRLNPKFSIAAYSGLWETSSLLAVVHN